MKHFGFLLGFIASAIAAPTPGYPDKLGGGFLPVTVAQQKVSDRWPAGEKKDCVFWTGFDGGIPKDDIQKFVGKLSNPAVTWYTFFTDDQARDWNWGLGDANSGYTIGTTSAAYAERCGRDGLNVWLLIPSDRSPDDPYPEGAQRPRKANWKLWEEPFVTLPNAVTKIHRVDPKQMDDDMKDDKKIIWKKGDGAKGTTQYPEQKQ